MSWKDAEAVDREGEVVSIYVKKHLISFFITIGTVVIVSLYFIFLFTAVELNFPCGQSCSLSSSLHCPIIVILIFSLPWSSYFHHRHYQYNHSHARCHCHCLCHCVFIVVNIIIVVMVMSVISIVVILIFIILDIAVIFVLHYHRHYYHYHRLSLSWYNNYVKKSIFTSPLLWNSLSRHIRDAGSQDIFKRHCENCSFKTCLFLIDEVTVVFYI